MAATETASSSAANATPAAAIINGIGNVINGISNFVLGSKALDNQAIAEKDQYNIIQTQNRGQFSLMGWSNLSKQTSTDSATGFTIIGALAVIVVIMLITKRK